MARAKRAGRPQPSAAPKLKRMGERGCRKAGGQAGSLSARTVPVMRRKESGRRTQSTADATFALTRGDPGLFSPGSVSFRARPVSETAYGLAKPRSGPCAVLGRGVSRRRGNQKYGPAGEEVRGLRMAARAAFQEAGHQQSRGSKTHFRMRAHAIAAPYVCASVRARRARRHVPAPELTPQKREAGKPAPACGTRPSLACLPCLGRRVSRNPRHSAYPNGGDDYPGDGSWHHPMRITHRPTYAVEAGVTAPALPATTLPAARSSNGRDPPRCWQILLLPTSPPERLPPRERMIRRSSACVWPMRRRTASALKPGGPARSLLECRASKWLAAAQ
ncbi:uncharacterized protein PSFLO_04999 [Pseudozyma flocculosa]|uniref:Uncharacterized protein n=1 Tax=Pseudozyma flocculosa TaxID=84751 RepID=A0A5C3F4V6_9BASI|nr:uncharacterized protein PSFLO_04999 [Pseudozyma flocculosa]